jgi:hypothetical protein
MYDWTGSVKNHVCKQRKYLNLEFSRRLARTFASGFIDCIQVISIKCIVILHQFGDRFGVNRKNLDIIVSRPSFAVEQVNGAQDRFRIHTITRCRNRMRLLGNTKVHSIVDVQARLARSYFGEKDDTTAVNFTTVVGDGIFQVALNDATFATSINRSQNLSRAGSNQIPF